MIAAAAVVIGLLAALAYAARRRWIDAVLALVAGVALAGTVGEFTLPGEAGATLTVDAADPPRGLGGVRTLHLDSGS